MSKVPFRSDAPSGPLSDDVLLNVTPTHLWYQGGRRVDLRTVHDPYIFAAPADARTAAQKAQQIRQALADAREDSSNPLNRIAQVREPILLKSFANPGKFLEVIPIVLEHAGRDSYVTQKGQVVTPLKQYGYNTSNVSEALFSRYNCWTMEHDVPYHQRALADLAGTGKAWPFDTRGQEKTLRVLCYDIETTQWQNFEAEANATIAELRKKRAVNGVEGKVDDAERKAIEAEAASRTPIDVLGWAIFDVSIRSHLDLSCEKFDFEFTKVPASWQEVATHQTVARNVEEEARMLYAFLMNVVSCDIIAGHNLLGFDNRKVKARLERLLADHSEVLSPGMKRTFTKFIADYCRDDQSFLFGEASEVTHFHPTSLDTLLVAKKVYNFDDFSLKGLAPQLGVKIPDRQYLTYQELDLNDPRTLKYADDDVKEQIGITLTLLQQALSMSFITGATLEELFSGGNTRMWDHMGLLRASFHNKLFPASVQAQRTIASLLRLKCKLDRVEIGEAVRKHANQTEHLGFEPDRDLLKLARYGPEMPEWVEYADGLAYREGEMMDGGKRAQGGEQRYEMPGGYTAKPQEDLNSVYIPYFNVIEADVAAMYPTILKAKNAVADTVRIARAGETPDDWVWFYKVGPDLLNGRFVTRPIDPKLEPHAKVGVMVGIMCSRDPGMVNLGMTSVLSYTTKVKHARDRAYKEGNKQLLAQLKDQYQAMKAARNAGTHGIMTPYTVACRQFAPLPGTWIPATGQKIMQDIVEDFTQRQFRIIYIDTDGIAVATSKSARDVEVFRKVLGEDPAKQGKWISKPEDVLAAIQGSNDKWRKLLDYDGWQLEAEPADGMVLIAHKNYIKLKVRKDAIDVDCKGANFTSSDKPEIAKVAMRDIVRGAILDVDCWGNESEARDRFRNALQKHFDSRLKTMDVKAADIQDLTLTQEVRSEKSYAKVDCKECRNCRTNAGVKRANRTDVEPQMLPCTNRQLNSHGKRSVALQRVVGEIKSSAKFNFVVSKKPLDYYIQAPQGYVGSVAYPKKSDVKPVEYMWPVDKVPREDIDQAWYVSMAETYIRNCLNIGKNESQRQMLLSFAWKDEKKEAAAEA